MSYDYPDDYVPLPPPPFSIKRWLADKYWGVVLWCALDAKSERLNRWGMRRIDGGPVYWHDREHGIEGDATASYRREVSDLGCIDVDPVTGDPEARFTVTPREARCLAAQLLRAAVSCERDRP